MVAELSGEQEKGFGNCQRVCCCGENCFFKRERVLAEKTTKMNKQEYCGGTSGDKIRLVTLDNILMKSFRETHNQKGGIYAKVLRSPLFLKNTSPNGQIQSRNR